MIHYDGTDRSPLVTIDRRSDETLWTTTPSSTSTGRLETLVQTGAESSS